MASKKRYQLIDPPEGLYLSQINPSLLTTSAHSEAQARLQLGEKLRKAFPDIPIFLGDCRVVRVESPQSEPPEEIQFELNFD